MNHAHVDQVAAAVLYEGYLLYPYRPALKNRQRWTFGGLYPQEYSEANGGSDGWMMQTECLVEGSPQSRVSVNVRCLHLMQRRAGRLLAPGQEWPEEGEPEFEPLEVLRVGETSYPTWQEAIERDVQLEETPLAALTSRPRRREFTFSGRRALEPVRTGNGEIAGVLLREQTPVRGAVELSAEMPGNGLFKLTCRTFNLTQFSVAKSADRDAALMHSLVSAHTILHVREGAFVSATDPGPRREQADRCRNVGAWPVLVGEVGQRETMLSAPIILEDYPRVAPESPGDFFDCTEIDEMLALRVMTLTDEEKRQMASVDELARGLLQRTEELSQAQLSGLHGMMRMQD